MLHLEMLCCCGGEISMVTTADNVGPCQEQLLLFTWRCLVPYAVRSLNCVHRHVSYVAKQTGVARVAVPLSCCSMPAACVRTSP
jgi:hypothetical protein